MIFTIISKNVAVYFCHVLGIFDGSTLSVVKDMARKSPVIITMILVNAEGFWVVPARDRYLYMLSARRGGFGLEIDAELTAEDGGIANLSRAAWPNDILNVRLEKSAPLRILKR